MQSSDGTVSYTYDPTGQLLSATYTGDQTDEMYTYDANGNRTTDGYVTGADNRLLSDGTYCYLYDAEGNRTTRFIDVNQNTLLDAGDTDVTEYSWDNRSRLIKVIDRAVANGPITQVVDYLYDTEDRWIGKDVDLDGDGVIDQMTRFVYNGPQIILQFEGDSSNDLTVSDLTHRYTWDPSVIDHLMADEQVTNPQTPGDVVIPLSDHLGTIRDLAVYDPATYTTTIATHRTYDSYGTLLTESGPIDCLFSFTGRPFDNATDLQNNYHRWYDTITDRWMSQDPIGFKGKDTNTYRYVGNDPINLTDPTGLIDGVTTPGWVTCPDNPVLWAKVKDNPPKPTPAEVALSAIDSNRAELTAAAAKEFVDMFKASTKKIEVYSHEGNDENKTPIYVTITLTQNDIEKIANALAEEYVAAVEKFLNDYPGAEPSNGFSLKRSVKYLWSLMPERVKGRDYNPEPIEDIKADPLCTDWADGIQDILNGATGLLGKRQVKVDNWTTPLRLCDLVVVKKGQFGTTGEIAIQHNFCVIQPKGYIPKNPPQSDNVIRILDPWFSLMPRVHTVKTHPTGISRIK